MNLVVQNCTEDLEYELATPTKINMWNDGVICRFRVIRLITLNRVHGF